MMEERYTIDDFKKTKCCLTCYYWNVDITLQGRSKPCSRKMSSYGQKLDWESEVEHDG